MAPGESTRSSSDDRGSRSDAPRPDDGVATDGGDPDELSKYLPEGMTLSGLRETVDECSTVLDVQRATRLPRWKVKRLLHHAGLRDDVESTAKRVAELRDDEG